jgi:membrane-bound inhibitor of C-type lysozyme
MGLSERGRETMMKLATSFGVVLIILCVSHAALAEQARYRCRDGSHIMATFDNGASGGSGLVDLSFGKGMKTLTLPQVLSADGGRYAGQNIEFWVKGRGATLTRDGKATTCTTR